MAAQAQEERERGREHGPEEGEREFTFSRFARQDFYKAVNAHLIQLLDVEPGMRVVDLACGTGAVTKLLLERLQGLRNSVIVAVDASAEALEIARREISRTASTAVSFVQARAEELAEKLKETVDAVVFCNAIHLVEDKAQALREIAQLLKPQGQFAFNSTFFAEAQPPETERFYLRWMSRAVRILRRDHGLRPSRDVKVAARRPLSVEEYRELLRAQGFQVRRLELETVPVPLEGWLGISEFGDFIRGALPGVPLAEGRRALQEAVTAVFRDLELTAVPRRWLQVVAVRSP